LSRSLQSCLPTSLWHELTAIYCFDESRISGEIHVGRQRRYRCSYKMVLRRKHAVHQSTTPFQNERYSRPRQLAASFPFPAHAKNRKTPLPNRPIHWRSARSEKHQNKIVVFYEVYILFYFNTYLVLLCLPQMPNVLGLNPGMQSGKLATICLSGGTQLQNILRKISSDRGCRCRV